MQNIVFQLRFSVCWWRTGYGGCRCYYCASSFQSTCRCIISFDPRRGTCEAGGQLLLSPVTDEGESLEASSCHLYFPGFFFFKLFSSWKDRDKKCLAKGQLLNHNAIEWKSLMITHSSYLKSPRPCLSSVPWYVSEAGVFACKLHFEQLEWICSSQPWMLSQTKKRKIKQHLFYDLVERNHVKERRFKHYLGEHKRKWCFSY